MRREEEYKRKCRQELDYYLVLVFVRGAPDWLPLFMERICRIVVRYISRIPY